jgi:hypothetical protein
VTTVAEEKPKRTTYSEWVLAALGIQHATRMQRVILSSAACPVQQHFSILSHKRHDFRKKKKRSLNIEGEF